MSGSDQICAGQTENFQKSDDTTVVDYLSNLPDDVIVHILSMLTVKDAVRTSVLSKDWKNSWTSIYNINIDVKEFFDIPSEDEDKAVVFANFVERIFAFEHKLSSFHVKLSDFGESMSSDFTEWIAAVLKREVQNLHIIICCDDFHEFPSDFRWPILHCNLQTCCLLKSLEVVMPCVFKIVDLDCFAKLVSLKLSSVTLEKESKSKKMILNFLVLREIQLEVCNWGAEVVEIHAPSLRLFASAAECFTGAKYQIKIFAPCLENLVTYHGPPESIILIDSPVVYACVTCHRPSDSEFEDCGLQIRKLFGELSHAHRMLLMGFLEAIRQTRRGVPLQSLTKLEEMRVISHIDIEGLLEVL